MGDHSADGSPFDSGRRGRLGFHGGSLLRERRELAALINSEDSFPADGEAI
jgi:hypothetical protein